MVENNHEMSEMSDEAEAGRPQSQNWRHADTGKKQQQQTKHHLLL